MESGVQRLVVAAAAFHSTSRLMELIGLEINIKIVFRGCITEASC